MGESHDAEAGALVETGAERVVHHQFGFAHAAALVCFALLFLSTITLPSLDPAPQQVSAVTRNDDPALMQWDEFTPSDEERLYKLLDRAPALFRQQSRRPPGKVERPAAVDARVDDAFAALDRSNLKQLDAFLAKHREHAYAVAQGYIVQVDAWRKEAQWAAEEARLRKEQNAVEWSYD